MATRYLSAFFRLALSCAVVSLLAEDALGSEKAFAFRARVVLHGDAAVDLVTYCGLPSGGSVTDIALSPIEIKKIEVELGPLLANDLRSEHSTHKASDYYLQYATAIWRSHKLGYMLGFYGEAADSSHPYWLSKPVIVSDGGSGYWCAAFDQTTNRFVEWKQEGMPPRTVQFNGYA